MASLRDQTQADFESVGACHLCIREGGRLSPSETKHALGPIISQFIISCDVYAQNDSTHVTRLMMHFVFRVGHPEPAPAIVALFSRITGRVGDGWGRGK